MYNSKKVIIIFSLIMIGTTITQYLMREYNFLPQIQALIEEVKKGFVQFKGLGL